MSKGRITYARAAALHKKFMGFVPDRVQVVETTDGRSLVRLGNAAEIKYISEKDLGKGRKARGYVHRFTRGTRLYAREIKIGNRRAASLVILGAKLRLTKRGIEG